MTYREASPRRLPTRNEAEEITSPRLVYRLVRNNPPIRRRLPAPSGLKNPLHSSTFRSAGPAECPCSPTSAMQKGKPDDATSETSIPCLVTLTAGAGRIKKTGGSSHYTWWPYDSYDVLANCQLVHP